MQIEKIQKVTIGSAILSTLIIVPILMDPIVLPKFAIIWTIIGLMFLLTLANQFEFLKRVSKPALVISIIYVAALFVRFLLDSQSLEVKLFGTWARNLGLLTSLIFIFGMLILSIPSENTNANRISKSLFILGLFFAPYALLQINNLDPIKYFFPWYNLSNWIVLTIGNSNFASIFLSMTFSATLQYLFQKNLNSYLKFMVLISLILHLYLLPLIDTQGKICYGVGSSIVIGLLLVQNKKSYLRILGIVWFLLTFIIGFLGILGLFGRGPFAKVLEDNVRALVDRLYTSLAAFEMMRDFPLWGVGIDSYSNWYRFYRSEQSWELKNNLPTFGYDNAHNTFFQIGATYGIVTLILYLVLVTYISAKMVLCLSKLRSEKIEASYNVLFAIWVIYLVQSLVSIDQLQVGIWAWLSAGCFLSFSSRSRNMGNIERKESAKSNSKKISESKNRSIWKNLNRVVILCLGLFLVFSQILLIQVVNNDRQIFQGLKRIPSITSESERHDVFTAVASKASNSKQAELRLIVVRYLAQGNELDLSLALAKETTQKFPRSYTAWELLSQLYELKNDKNNAYLSRQETLKLDPLNEYTRLKLLELQK